MKKVLSITLLAQIAFFSMSQGAARALGRPKKDPAQLWNEEWAMFNQQIADLEAMRSTLPPAAQKELDDVTESLNKLEEITPRGQVLIQRGTNKKFFNGVEILEEGGFQTVNDKAFIDGKEIDLTTGRFKNGSSLKPADVKSKWRVKLDFD